MMWLYLTLICVFVLFLPYEIYCMQTGKPTLSKATTDLSRRHPLIGFLLGCFMGGLAIHVVHLKRVRHAPELQAEPRASRVVAVRPGSMR